jgi:hypothetical protein
MANSTANAVITVSHGGSGTRDSDGNLTWYAPPSTRSHSMQGFTQFDVDRRLSGTINEQDLSALNLDGSGTKDLTGLYGFIVYEYVEGSGSVLIEPGDTNGAAWHQTVTIGGGTTHARVAVQPLTAGATVTGSLKTLDHTVTGTIVYSMTVYVGTST